MSWSRAEDLTGRRVLITGAARGIGARFSECGAQVALAGWNRSSSSAWRSRAGPVCGNPAMSRAPRRCRPPSMLRSSHCE